MAIEEMKKSFPSSVDPTIINIEKKILLKSKFAPIGQFHIRIGTEIVEIPQRIYFEEPDESNLSDQEKRILSCYFTRHHDGYIREKHLRRIVDAKEEYETPFIFQLLGEYVVQIIMEIDRNATVQLLDRIVKLGKENPEYFRKTKARVTSYWNCYYRQLEFPKWEQYPGNQLFNKIDRHERSEKRAA